MAADKFRSAEAAYFNLRGQFDAGRITRAEFDEKLRELMVQDALGRYWSLGADDGAWYFHDGSNWVPGNPSDGTMAAPVAQPAPPAAPVTIPLTNTPTAVRIPQPTAPRERGAGIPLLPILLGGAIILAIGAFLIFQVRDRIFVAQQPIATSTRILSPTSTSEPDFFDTRTPVPTAPVAIVVPTQQPPGNIPTVTPFALSTPVSQLPLPPTGRLRLGNGPDARARYMPVAQFSLDGALDEWSGDEVPLTVAHFGAENWSGPKDLSGKAWLGWNENFLLIAVSVVDDAHVQTQQGWEMFRGDSVELWIDADLEGDFDVAAGNEDDYQFGFSPGDSAGLVPEGVLYLPYRDPLVNQQILVAAKLNATGYRLEAAVPWTVLRVQPGQGRVLGYTVDLSDNDVPLTAQQQTQVNHNPNLRFQMPATFGNLILE